MSSVIRPRADACPGVVATHEAADGALARVRLPGGVLAPAQAHALATCANELGDGAVHLTSRGNLQLRGVRDATGLARALGTAGLVPSFTHERVRNILASPLSGLCGGRFDVRPLVSRLDAAVCGRAELSRLPGRFLFALDDGRGDVAAEDTDVCWQALDTRAESRPGAVLLGGADSGLRVPAERAVDAMVAAASAFVATGASGWRLRELAAAELTAVRDAVWPSVTDRVDRPGALPTADPPQPGPVTVSGGPDVVVAAPAFGRVPAQTLHRIGDSSHPVVVTPWRTLVVSGITPADLADLGFAVDPAAPQAAVSACVGAPGCAKSWADVRADTRAALRELTEVSPGARAHVSGCSRRCGKPHGAYTDVLATEDGYRVGDTLVSADELADTLKGIL